MLLPRAVKVIVVLFILTFGLLIPIFPTVNSQSAGQTTLYFTDYDPFSSDTDFGNTLMNTTPPVNDTDSKWPPAIFIKQDGKILPTPNSDELLVWYELWILYKFYDILGGDYGELPEEFDYFKELFNPFKVSEDYIYSGEEQAVVSGQISFDIYLSSKSNFLREKDNVKISVSKTSASSLIPLPEELKSATYTIDPVLISGNIKQYQININLENESISLNPEDSLTFSVEIIPSERFFSKLLNLAERLGLGDLEIIEKFGNFLSERNVEQIKNVGITITEFVNLTNEFQDMGANITISDFGDIFDVLQSSSFVFASTAHPSSVTIPIALSGDIENSKTYYLHDSNMDESKVENENPTETEITSASAVWQSPSIVRNKILKSASASIYIKNRGKKLTVSATLYNGNELIDTQYSELSGKVFLTDPNEPVSFVFETGDEEIEYNDNLRLEIAVSNDSNPGFIAKVLVLSDGQEFQSYLNVQFEETDHIKTDLSSNPSNANIIPGESVEYTLNVESELDDDIQIEASEENSRGDWNIDLDESSFSLSAGDSKEVKITVTSEDNTKDAYGDYININIITSGKTGISKKESRVDVTEDAIDYDIEIVTYTKEKDIKKGNEGTFFFIVKNNNTGAIDDIDSYSIEVESENDWEVDFVDSINNLKIGEKTGPKQIFAIVSIPENTSKKSDTLTFTVTSESDSNTLQTVTVKVNVIGGSIFDEIYKSFEDLSDSLGLNDAFGEYGPFVLLSIIMIIILFVIIILALLLTQKSVKITCTERIKEIGPDGEAVFEINLENPTKNDKTYEIDSFIKPASSKWKIATNVEKISVEGKKSALIILMIKPTAEIEPGDWTEAFFTTNVSGRKKKYDITLIASITEGKTILQIKDVFNWPKQFKKGDKVISSFKLKNKGNVAARNVKVYLYINGKEKNKVEVSIPGGGYADIKMPWLAEKGKNDLHIKVEE